MLLTYFITFIGAAVIGRYSFDSLACALNMPIDLHRLFSSITIKYPTFSSAI